MGTRDRDAMAKAIAGSRSIREALGRLGVVPAGGNYQSFKRAVATFGLDTSHFAGQAHLRGKTHDYTRRPLKAILRKGRVENTYRLKRRLVSEGLKPHRCERCGLTEWTGVSIPLELHHKDGNRANNLYRNLELLCPNCHALTDNYRGKNKKV